MALPLVANFGSPSTCSPVAKTRYDWPLEFASAAWFGQRRAICEHMNGFQNKPLNCLRLGPTTVALGEPQSKQFATWRRSIATTTTMNSRQNICTLIEISADCFRARWPTKNSLLKTCAGVHRLKKAKSNSFVNRLFAFQLAFFFKKALWPRIFKQNADFWAPPFHVERLQTANDLFVKENIFLGMSHFEMGKLTNSAFTVFVAACSVKWAPFCKCASSLSREVALNGHSLHK